MVTDKQKANLAKGRAKGIKRKKTANKCDDHNTWQALYSACGELPLTDKEKELMRMHGATNEFLSKRGIVKRKKFTYALLNYTAMVSSPAMANNVMQREEPQDVGVKLSGAVDVFNYATIDRLLAPRPAGDSRES